MVLLHDECILCFPQLSFKSCCLDVVNVSIDVNSSVQAMYGILWVFMLLYSICFLDFIFYVGVYFSVIDIDNIP